LIQRAGGIITARNRKSGGAAFSIWLPSAQNAPIEASSKAAE